MYIEYRSWVILARKYKPKERKGAGGGGGRERERRERITPTYPRPHHHPPSLLYLTNLPVSPPHPNPAHSTPPRSLEVEAHMLLPCEHKRRGGQHAFSIWALRRGPCLPVPGHCAPRPAPARPTSSPPRVAGAGSGGWVHAAQWGLLQRRDAEVRLLSAAKGFDGTESRRLCCLLPACLPACLPLGPERVFQVALLALLQSAVWC